MSKNVQNNAPLITALIFTYILYEESCINVVGDRVVVANGMLGNTSNILPH